VIDWIAFLSVAGAALLASVIVVGFYSLGLRLLDTDGSGRAHGIRRFSAIACFIVCTAAVLFGIYLIVPALHG
jgi:hypothetical protein